MSLLWEYDDLDIDGLPESSVLAVPRHVQDCLREFRPDDLRIIRNDPAGMWTVVIRAPWTFVRWHGGEVLKGWGIVAHHEGPLGDGTPIVKELRSMWRAADWGNDPERSEREYTREVERNKQLARERSDKHFDELAEDHFGQRPEALEAFDREVAEAEEREMDQTHRHAAHTKVSIPAGVQDAAKVDIS